MALIKWNQISSTAKVYPQCGAKPPKTSKLSWFITLLIFALLNISNALASDLENKISPYAISPLKKSQNPKAFAKWGAKDISKINGLLKDAALFAAKSPSCDKVDIVDLSDARSTPPNTIVFYVDCVNGQRFYISEQDIKGNTTAVSKQERTKNISDSEATNACVDNIKASLQFPSSFDRKILSASVYRADTGNIVVSFDFDAKNGIGNTLPQKARCVIDDKGINPPEITNR